MSDPAQRLIAIAAPFYGTPQGEVGDGPSTDRTPLYCKVAHASQFIFGLPKSAYLWPYPVQSPVWPWLTNGWHVVG